MKRPYTIHKKVNSWLHFRINETVINDLKLLTNKLDTNISKWCRDVIVDNITKQNFLLAKQKKQSVSQHNSSTNTIHENVNI